MRKLSFFPHKELSDQGENEVIPSVYAFSQTYDHCKLKNKTLKGAGLPSFSGGDKDAGSGGPGRWAGHAGRCLRARAANGRCLGGSYRPPPRQMGSAYDGLSCGWVVHELGS